MATSESHCSTLTAPSSLLHPHCSTLTALFDCVPLTSALVGNFARDCCLRLTSAISPHDLLRSSPCHPLSLPPFSLFLPPYLPPFSLPPSLLPSLLPSFPPSLLPSLSPSFPLSLLHRYVVRRILRRGVRFCTEKLNAEPGVFASLVMTVVDSLVRMYL